MSKSRKPGKSDSKKAARKKGKSKAEVERPDPGAGPDQVPGGGSQGGEQPDPGPMKERDYLKAIKPLHGELVALQEWVKATGAKIVIVFEGRDTAGKGGVIKAITERVSPRVFRVVALPAPSEREKSQMYVQRYLPYLPAAGEVVIFDRSWYNRAGVERVMGFTPMPQVEQFLDQVPGVEKAMVQSGIILIKYWLEVGPQEQTRRLEGRIDDPRKVWKLSPMDVASYEKWDDYTVARDAMLAASNTSWAPWYVARTEDKRRGRLNVISHLLEHIPYEHVAVDKVVLPERDVQEVPPPVDFYHPVPERY